MGSHTLRADRCASSEAMTSREMPEVNQGWAWPILARRAHYFGVDSVISLCGKWMLGGQRNDFNHNSPDNCRACNRRRLAAIATMGT